VLERQPNGEEQVAQLRARVKVLVLVVVQRELAVRLAARASFGEMVAVGVACWPTSCSK
jgi:hypothetical protein